MNGRRTFHARHELRVGTREVVVVGVAFGLILALTFASGVLVGRELGLEPAPAPGVGGEAGAPSPRERAAPGDGARVEEPLTFYQALTAPTPELPDVGRPTVEERIVPREGPTKPARKTEPVRTVPAVQPSQGITPVPTRVRPRDGHVSRPAPLPRWTVQVSSFRSAALARRLRARLTARGFEAYVVSVATDAGRVRHRVRVGDFRTRTEAEQVARALRARRHPNAFVTARTD